ncbi:anti-phage protein KwaB [Stenotrophomonas humi]
MTAEELKTLLQAYYDGQANIGICVYALLKDANKPGPFRLDIEADAESGLKDLFLQSLRDEISSKDELYLLDLSAADERLNAVYVYDLDIPAELETLEAVISKDDLPVLDLKGKSLSSIKALLVEIGNDAGQVVLYKTMAPVNIFGRSSFFLKKHESRLERLDDEFLRVSAGFQMMRINGVLLVLNLEALEHNFGFHDVIKREAASGVDAIVAAELVTNPDVLRELVDDVKYARRLTKIAKASPVLKAGISPRSIVNFCKTFPHLVGRIRFNEESDRIILDTKVSKDLFIKVLMDDFLTSELTKFHYASVAKDAVEPVEEQGEA